MLHRLSRRSLEQMALAARVRLLATYTPLGAHAETGDITFLTTKDRTRGCHALGIQGGGKSFFLLNQALHDARQGEGLVLIDPHGDAVYDFIARMPQEAIGRTYLLDIRDTNFAVGLNMLAPVQGESRDQHLNRLLHIFEVVWSDEAMGQQFFPNYVRAAILTLLDNLGTTLLDMLPLLTSQQARNQYVANVQDESVRQFWYDHDALSPSAQAQHVAPLVNRLNAWFMGRPTLRSIVGQKETTLDLRQVRENREIILVPIPLKTNKLDAQLVGTILTSLIYSATFSQADTPMAERRDFSVFVDEFEHFATSDFAELFTEGRKFGVRTVLSNQFLGQLPPFLRQAVETAGTKVCFQLTADDARERAQYFIHGQTAIRPEDTERSPVEQLLHSDIPDPNTEVFMEFYVRPNDRYRQGRKIVINRPGARFDYFVADVLRVERPKTAVTVDDPLPLLNHLLYLTMVRRDPMLPIPWEVVAGFANAGKGYYRVFHSPWWLLNRKALLSEPIAYPPYLVNGTGFEARWTRLPESEREQLLHFLFHLRATCLYLAQYPLGKSSVMSQSEVAQQIASLPKRMAFVQSGESTCRIQTLDAPEGVDAQELEHRLSIIREQTRAKYCQPVSQADNTPPPESDDEPPASRWEEDK